MMEVNAELPYQLSAAEELEICERHFLTGMPKANFSMLFLIQVDRLYFDRSVDPGDVVDEVRGIEGVGGPTGTKPPSRFRRQPLAGLWHKHWTTARFVPKNITNHWGIVPGSGKRLDAMLEEEFAAETSGVVTEDLINRIAHRLVTEAFEARAGDGALSGEWIVYAEHRSQRYYLTLASHQEDDTAIDDRISRWCKRQFPFLFDQ